MEGLWSMCAIISGIKTGSNLTVLTRIQPVLVRAAVAE